MPVITPRKVFITDNSPPHCKNRKQSTVSYFQYNLASWMTIYNLPMSVGVPIYNSCKVVVRVKMLYKW